MQLTSRVWNWLGRIFDPPVTQRHFDRAMAEQTEVIRSGNADIITAVREVNAEILALVAEMKAAVSDLSEAMRADYEARASDAVGCTSLDDDAG